ncbi:MAG: TAXI family TRAP transporter solute-binding subunit [Vicinamibacterales bacterium]
MTWAKPLAPWALVCLVAAGAPGCGSRPAAGGPVTLAIATGGPGGAFYPLGVALAGVYEAGIPGLRTTVGSGGSSQNVQALEDGRAQIAFTQSDVAYVAYRRGLGEDPHAFQQLRGIAVLWMNTVQVAVTTDSGIRDIAGLRGKRVSVGTRGSGTETLARIVLESYDLTYADLEPSFPPFVETVALMRAGKLDAAFVVAGTPTVAMTEMSATPGVRLLPIPRDQVRAMRGQYPFLQPQVIPGGTYPGNDADVETVGVSSMLACRQDLDEPTVYRLTRLLFEALPALQGVHPAAGLITLEEGPATPIPLHPGAARYYREREIFR